MTRPALATASATAPAWPVAAPAAVPEPRTAAVPARIRGSAAGPHDDAITIRAARSTDAPALARLAHLDAAPRVPAGDVLVALIGGAPVAALSVEHGDHVADPFHPVSAELLPLLELRAATLRAPHKDRRTRAVSVWRGTP